jgi:hypothetical protein
MLERMIVLALKDFLSLVKYLVVVVLMQL